MKGIIYKVDQNGNCTSNIIEAYLISYSNSTYIESDSFQTIEIKKGDRLYYSDNDMEINCTYEVEIIISKKRISVIKV